jgi:hypothetical protein
MTFTPPLPPQHRIHKSPGFVKRILFSFAGAALFHFVWLAAFITLGGKPPGGFVTVAFWCVAPLLTSLGFACGMILHDHLAHERRRRFFSVWIWPLIGCAAGAAIFFAFGPMFIGFAMFVSAGSVLVVRELVLSRRNRSGA